MGVWRREDRESASLMAPLIYREAVDSAALLSHMPVKMISLSRNTNLDWSRPLTTVSLDILHITNIISILASDKLGPEQYLR
jgi:hypothetical protein